MTLCTSHLCESDYRLVEVDKLFLMILLISVQFVKVFGGFCIMHSVLVPVWQSSTVATVSFFAIRANIRFLCSSRTVHIESQNLFFNGRI